MTFFELYKILKDRACININELYSERRETLFTDLSRWVKSGKLVRIRNSWYCLPETLGSEDALRVIASSIYRPAYISFEYALHFHGIIPEIVATLTCASSNKTNAFHADSRLITYTSLKPKLMYGYYPHAGKEGVTLLARPEKAIVDFLYIHNEYTTPEDMEELRFDEYFMNRELDWDRLCEFVLHSGSKALKERIDTLLAVHGLNKIR